MPLVLRPGEPRDMTACGEIIAAASRASVIHQRIPGLRSLFEDSRPLDTEGRRRLVAEQSGRVAGFADFDPESGHIRYLFVDPARQGLKLGQVARPVGDGRGEILRQRRRAALRDHLAAGGDEAPGDRPPGEPRRTGDENAHPPARSGADRR